MSRHKRLSLASPENLSSSYRTVCAAIDVIENDRWFINTQPKCEPQLGKRGPYAAIGGDKDAPKKYMAPLRAPNLSDGAHNLLDIAKRAEMLFTIIHDAARLLMEKGLLLPAREDDKP